MSYQSQRTYATAQSDASGSQNKQLDSTSDPILATSQPPKQPFNPSADKWGPFNPPKLKESQSFGYLLEPIKPSMASKNITTFIPIYESFTVINASKSPC